MWRQNISGYLLILTQISLKGNLQVLTVCVICLSQCIKLSDIQWLYLCWLNQSLWWYHRQHSIAKTQMRKAHYVCNKMQGYKITINKTFCLCWPKLRNWREHMGHFPHNCLVEIVFEFGNDGLSDLLRLSVWEQRAPSKPVIGTICIH